MTVALATLTGSLLSGLTEATDNRGGGHVITQIARLCRETAAASGIEWNRVRHAVIGVPGAPDLTTGRVMMAPNIPAFDTFDVRAAFAEALGCSVQLENDVNLSAEGERWALSTAAPVLDMAYISIGTGIGCGLICDGQLLRGAAHAAGEIAFLPFGADPFDPQSRDCGALEQEAGSHGMRRRYHALSGKDITVPEIFTLAEGAIQPRKPCWRTLPGWWLVPLPRLLPSPTQPLWFWVAPSAQGRISSPASAHLHPSATPLHPKSAFRSLAAAPSGRSGPAWPPKADRDRPRRLSHALLPGGALHRTASVETRLPLRRFPATFTAGKAHGRRPCPRVATRQCRAAASAAPDAG
ncbi:ROK family protein [Pannonibacter sp. Pt2-lr]